MSTPIDYQVIHHGGKPIFALLPWDEFERLRRLLAKKEVLSDGIPQEVVEAHVGRGLSIVRSWREYLSISKEELASRLNIPPDDVDAIEASQAKLRKADIRRIAKALGLTPGQLDV